jgi:8-oxo-dGTP pyrophosphatase MutT (NUDIX family)
MNSNNNEMSKSKDLYFVAVKLFVRDGDKLLILHDTFGAWDLPGGRIKKDEFNTPLSDVIVRKIHEELGDDIKIELGEPNSVFFRVERFEEGLDKTVRIFAVGYDAKYLSGEVELGSHMEKYEWVDVRTFKPENYFKGGWLTGVQEYLVKQ